MNSNLETLQRSIYETVRDRQELNGIPVINSHPDDLSSQIQWLTAQPLGLSISILPPKLTQLKNNLALPLDGEVECTIRILEDLYTNRSGKSAIEVGEFLLQLLNGRSLAGNALTFSLMAKTNSPWALKEDFPNDSKILLELTFTTTLTLAEF